MKLTHTDVVEFTESTFIEQRGRLWYVWERRYVLGRLIMNPKKTCNTYEEALELSKYWNEKIESLPVFASELKD